MTTNYDPIADQYRRAKQQPWRAAVELFTMMTLIGDLSAKAVVDIACGEGFYTRILQRKGAAKVLGIDLSEQMIALAQASEAREPLGVQYMVGDGRALGLGPDYDLAVAGWLLNYAHDRTELDAMCRSVVGCLKQGARFVTINCNPACDFPSAPSYRKYGFDTAVVGDFREGATITWTFYLADGPLSIENYFLSVQTHEDALRAAGFREIRWHAPMLAPQAAASEGRRHWSDLLEHPPMTFIECVK